MLTIAGGVIIGVIGLFLIKAIGEAIRESIDRRDRRYFEGERELRERPERERREQEWRESQEREREQVRQRRERELLERPERHADLERIAREARERRLTGE